MDQEIRNRLQTVQEADNTRIIFESATLVTAFLSGLLEREGIHMAKNILIPLGILFSVMDFAQLEWVVKKNELKIAQKIQSYAVSNKVLINKYHKREDLDSIRNFFLLAAYFAAFGLGYASEFDFKPELDELFSAAVIAVTGFLLFYIDNKIDSLKSEKTLSHLVGTRYYKAAERHKPAGLES